MHCTGKYLAESPLHCSVHLVLPPMAQWRAMHDFDSHALVARWLSNFCLKTQVPLSKQFGSHVIMIHECYVSSGLDLMSFWWWRIAGQHAKDLSESASNVQRLQDVVVFATIQQH